MAHFSNDGGLFQEKKRSILDRKMAIERLIPLGYERDHSHFYILGKENSVWSWSCSHWWSGLMFAVMEMGRHGGWKVVVM